MRRKNPPLHLQGRGTMRSMVEGFYGLSMAPPPGFAWSPSPANAGEDLGHYNPPSQARKLRPGMKKYPPPSVRTKLGKGASRAGPSLLGIR